ncbi:hypothetical protein BJX61DRAFT_542761 [Aspergillus egyptiacus]|nr:hypothetical protein BJX61DRAFT_542761 [Aspergillus egyptiacus]
MPTPTPPSTPPPSPSPPFTAPPPKYPKRILTFPRATGQPRLGDESPGWYHAPNGKRYMGVGRVVFSGFDESDRWRVLVEPIPEKMEAFGGVYRFFDVETDEDMPDFGAGDRNWSGSEGGKEGEDEDRGMDGEGEDEKEGDVGGGAGT